MEGRSVDLSEGEVTIGRSRGCTIPLQDASVSRTHAVLSVQLEKATIRDLGSSNGTYLNGRRIDKEVTLAEGDRLTIGETELVMRVAGPPVVDPAATVQLASLQEPPAPPSRRQTVEAKAPPSVPPPPPAGAETSAEELLGPPQTEIYSEPLGRPDLSMTPAPRGAPETLPAFDEGPGELLSSIEEVEYQTPSPPTVSPAPEPRLLPAAGFWVRLAAYLVDVALIMLVSLGASLVAGGPTGDLGSSLFAVSSWILSFVIPVVGWMRWGTTPGKALFGLYVCTSDGQAGLSFGRAVLRWIGYLASALPLFVGFLMIAFTGGKRGLHDLIAGTYVGRRR